MDPRKKRVLDAYGREPENLDELAQAIIKTIDTTNSGWYDSKELCKVVGFSWNISYGAASNLHSAPMNGKQNWSRRDKNLPTSYPGWTGRVWIRYSDRLHSGSSRAFGNTLTYPGTGGGGGYDGPWESISNARWRRYGRRSVKDFYPEIDCYSWDYRFYLSDWPALQNEIKKQQVYNKLAGIIDSNPMHRFLWEDTEVKIADAAFMAECAIEKSKETA